MIINSTFDYAMLLYAMRDGFDRQVDDDPRAYWERAIHSLRTYDKNPIPEGGEDYPYDDTGGWLAGKEWLQEIEDGRRSV